MSNIDENNENIISSDKSKIYDSADNDGLGDKPKPKTILSAEDEASLAAEILGMDFDISSLDAPAPVAPTPPTIPGIPTPTSIGGSGAITQESGGDTTQVIELVVPDQLVVLTIDDDKWIQRIFSQYMQQWGLKHISAYDPFSGLAEAIKQQPHIIFLDMVLPDLHGDIVLQFLYKMEYTKHIPVVIISGNLNKDVIKSTYPYGVKGYVTKPFNQDVLYAKVKEVIDPKIFQAMLNAGKIAPVAIKKKPVLATNTNS